MCYTIQNNTLDYYAYFYLRKREIMTTQDYRTRRPLRIFLSYFRPHRGLFLLDITCAFFIAVIDLAFPLISRTAMYHWLPEKQFSIFFTVMALVVAAFVLRAVREPARPRSRCIARPTCCIRIVARCSVPECWWSAPARRSCITSTRCSPRWVRRVWSAVPSRI